MRNIERHYVQVFADRVSLDEWASIVDRAVQLAKDGDKASREWITRLVLGAEPMQLSGLARREMAGVTADAEIASAIEYDHTPPMMRPLSIDGPLQLAERNQVEAEQAKREATERESRRQKAAEKRQRASTDGAGQD